MTAGTILGWAGTWTGPEPTYRWGVLPAVAWIATRDMRWVKGTIAHENRPLDGYWGPHPETAEETRHALDTDLHVYRDDGWQLSYTGALSEFLRAISDGLPFRDDLGKPSVAIGASLRGLSFKGDSVGLTGADLPIEWACISLEVADVVKMWPPTNDLSRTGDPGRPSLSFELYTAELERRIAGSTVNDKLGEEAAYLIKWLKDNHPDRPCPSIGTVKNRIRDRHRERTK